MKSLQNEYYYKNKIQSAIDRCIQDFTKDDNELGYISENMVNNMTEAAWLVLKQNIDTNDYFDKEVIPTLPKQV